MLTRPQKLFLTAYYYRRLISCLLVALFCWWVFLPEAGQIDLETCAPKGAVAKLSAFFHGRSFWQAQLAYARDSRITAERWPEFRAKSRAQTQTEIARAEASMSTIYAAHPELA